MQYPGYPGMDEPTEIRPPQFMNGSTMMSPLQQAMQRAFGGSSNPVSDPIQSMFGKSPDEFMGLSGGQQGPSQLYSPLDDSPQPQSPWGGMGMGMMGDDDSMMGGGGDDSTMGGSPDTISEWSGQGHPAYAKALPERALGKMPDEPRRPGTWDNQFTGYGPKQYPPDIKGLDRQWYDILRHPAASPAAKKAAAAKLGSKSKP